MKSLERFIEESGITMTFSRVDSNPDMDQDPEWQANHYKIMIWDAPCNNRMTLSFSMGASIEREPTLGDILDCLASDASGINDRATFEEWAEDLGYSPDSRRAERAYKKIKEQTRELKRLLGEERFNELLYETERE